MTTGVAGEQRDARPLLAVVAVLAAYAIVRRAVLPGEWHFVANVAFATLAVVAALAAGYTTAELGLARRGVAAGLRWGVGAMVVVGVVLAVGVVIPGGRGWFEHDGADLTTGELLRKALWTIPVGTALVEELVFRGVVLAVSWRIFSARNAVLASAVIFGLWHIPPIVHDGPATVLGTVAATTAAGVGFALLRLRTGSVIAPMLAHVATNSGALTAAWIVTHA